MAPLDISPRYLLGIYMTISELKKIAKEASRMTGMLQGTMSLEGLGFDKERYKEHKRYWKRHLSIKQAKTLLRFYHW